METNEIVLENNKELGIELAPYKDGNPLCQANCGDWYFYDELWCDLYGPYKTEVEARTSLELYCSTL